MLGISAQAQQGVLRVHEPILPSWLKEVRIDRLRVQDSLVDLAFHRADEATSFSLLEQTGDIKVMLLG